jgi:hypothetical protein
MPVIFKAFVSGSGREHAAAILSQAQQSATEESAG